MSSVNHHYEVEEVIKKFDVLLENLNLILLEEGAKININKTKLAKYKKDLQRISELDQVSVANLMRIVTKYISLNELFNPESKIKYNRRDLVKIIKGQSVFEDGDESYNDTFFELSMGIRIALASDREAEVDLSGICDIIIDKDVAVECKYIHSENRIYDNIDKAIKQIDKRVVDNLATCGVVALDFSNLLKSKIQNFSQNLFFIFCENYSRIVEDKSTILDSVLRDKNFSKIVTHYIAHEMEIVFHENFVNRARDNKLGNNVFAIVYQVNDGILFEYDVHAVPVSIRSMNYICNGTLSGEMASKVKSFIHSLATGF